MPLTIIPLTLEVWNIVAIWFCDIPCNSLAKIILSVICVAKYVCYFIGGLIVGLGNIKLRNVFLTLCALLNVGIVVYAVITGMWVILGNNALLLILLIIWSFVAVFCNK